MFPTIVAIFTLTALAAGSELLLRVDIAITQKQGGNENSDIQFIEQKLSELTHVKVLFARKDFGNGRVLLVLTVQKICDWSTLTSAMTERGYKLTVSPLQYCSDYAEELGVDVTYNGMEEVNQTDVIEDFHVEFYDRGMTTDEYDAEMKKHFERDREVRVREDVKGVCFRKIGDLPVKLMYLVVTKSSDYNRLYKHLRNEGKASIAMDLVQSFKVYTEKC